MFYDVSKMLSVFFFSNVPKQTKVLYLSENPPKYGNFSSKLVKNLDKWKMGYNLINSYMTSPKKTTTRPLSYLMKRRKVLVERLTLLSPDIIRGSLIETYKRCGKKGCKCAEGRGHGPKYYLSISQAGGRPKMEYVSKEDQKKFQRHLSNFRKVKAILEEITKINLEILKKK